MSIENNIRSLYKQGAQLEDVVSILYELLARIQTLEAKVKENK